MTIPPLDELIGTIGRRDAGPLDRIGTAVTMADDLGALGDRLVTHYVAAAREAGCSWSQIGGQLGVSKQAAQQGHVAPATRRFGRRGRHFARLTDPARAAIKVAHEQAHALRNPALGTEHLLLGLLSDEAGGVAGAVLRGFGVTPAGVVSQVEAGPGPARRGHLPMSKRVRKVMELAVQAADGGPIGTEHLLLGLIDEGGGRAAQILGADLPALRRAVLEAMDGSR